MAILLPYPSAAASETSKPAGAVAVILPVKLLPDTVNCRICGSADAVPAHAEIPPMAAPVVMVGNNAGVRFTVMTYLTSSVQFMPAVTKFPNEVGYKPPGIFDSTAIVVVLINRNTFAAAKSKPALSLPHVYTRDPAGKFIGLVFAPFETISWAGALLE